MLPLPRVGGALSGALEGSIAGTGARVKRRLRVRRARGGQIRIADTGLILAARRAGSQLAASTAVRRTAAVVPSVSGS